MRRETAERWAWITLYSGLLVLCLGVFVLRADTLLGLVLVVAGAAGAVAGVGLIVLRSRMPP